MALKPEKNFDIKNLTSFKIGGIIDEVYFPETVDEFVQILNEFPNIQVFGNLSNTLISSDGFGGKIVLTTKMTNFEINGTKVIADAGVKGPRLSQAVCENGLAGFEFMIGFPGSIGGEVYMNASAHSQAISDHITAVTCYSKQDGVIRYAKDEMNFRYRTSRCQSDDLVVLKAEFELEKSDIKTIQAKMSENLEFRKTHQPLLNLPNCGSIFKNPQNNSAGKLLDSVGAKDLKIGGVRVWENHANFIVNDQNGTSTDVLELMSEMYKKVKNAYNIELEPEIRYLGSNNEKETEICNILYKTK